jgi:hypothetical protein
MQFETQSARARPDSHQPSPQLAIHQQAALGAIQQTETTQLISMMNNAE